MSSKKKSPKGDKKKKSPHHKSRKHLELVEENISLVAHSPETTHHHSINIEIEDTQSDSATITSTLQSPKVDNDSDSSGDEEETEEEDFDGSSSGAEEGELLVQSILNEDTVMEEEKPRFFTRSRSTSVSSSSSRSTHLSTGNTGSFLGKYVDHAAVKKAVEEMDSDLLKMEAIADKVEIAFNALALDAISDAMIVYHIALGILHVNENFESMFSISKSEAYGQNISMILPKSLRSHHEGYIRRYTKRWTQLGEPPTSMTVNAKKPMISTAVRRGLNSKSEEFKVAVRLRPLGNIGEDEMTKPTNLYICMVRDLSDASEMRKELTLYKNVFTNSIVGQVIINDRGTVLAGNACLGKMFGINVEDYVTNGYNIKYLMPDQVQRKHDDYLKRYRRDHARDRESKVIGRERSEYGRRFTPDGKGVVFPIKLAVKVLEDGAIYGNILDASKFVTDSEAEQRVKNATLPRRLAWSEGNLDSHEVLSGAVLMLDQKGYTNWVVRNRNNHEKQHDHHQQTYSQLDAICERYKLDVVDHEGDSVMAFSQGKRACKRAVYAAIEMIDWAERVHAGNSDDGEDSESDDYDSDLDQRSLPSLGELSNEHLLERLKRDRRDSNASSFIGEEEEMAVRIGISYGEVASGVYGSQRRFWKIGGYPIVLAARLEATAEPGHIQISNETRQHLGRKEKECFERMERRDLKGITKPSSHNNTSTNPNHESHTVGFRLGDNVEELGSSSSSSSSLKHSRSGHVESLTTFMSLPKLFSELRDKMAEEATLVAEENISEEQEHYKRVALAQRM